MLAETLTADGDVEVSDEEPPEPEPTSQDDDEKFQQIQQEVFDIVSTSGFFWVLEKQFVLLFSRSLCGFVKVNDPQKNGV